MAMVMVMWTAAAYGQTQSKKVDWLGLRVGGHPALSLYSLNKTGELSKRLRPS